MQMYLDLFTPETWKAFIEKGSTVVGFKASAGNRVSRIRIGDELLCYMVRLQRWVGLLKISSRVYLDETPYFSKENEQFTLRFNVEPCIILSPDHGVPISHLWRQLKMCEGVEQTSGWAYRVKIARSLIPIDEPDASFLKNVLLNQSRELEAFPFSDRDVKKLLPKK